jgi:hypothetical protein
LPSNADGGYFLGWSWTGFKGDTFWDWLSLLITPVTIAAISLAFSLQQGRASMAAGEQQRQDALVDAYFEHITHLLVEEGLLQAPAASPVRAAARARTVATLQRTGETHRAAIMRFLDESGLTSGDSLLLDVVSVRTESAGASELA